MVHLLLLAAAFNLVRLASCDPTVNFPLNSQLPPVVRVNEPFDYTISPYTFQSESNLSYSLSDAPKWLSIDSNNGRLHGTPEDDDVPSGDIVGQTVDIVAKDATGSTTMNSTLVISRNKPPKVKIPLSAQAKNFGDYSAPSSVLFYPSKKFSFKFDPGTFEHTPGSINYYAASADSSPLPSWIQFDAGSLTFSGITPPLESLIQPPQNFGLQLIASDIMGFSAASLKFSIVVGSRRLSAKAPIIYLNATLGKKLSYEGLTDGIQLDNQTVKKDEVQVSVVGMPDWLSLDKRTWAIEGTPRKSDDSANFTINFHDDFADKLSVQAIVNVTSGLFRNKIDNIKIRAGGKVKVDLKPYFSNPDDASINMKVTPTTDWLQLNEFELIGSVPEKASGKLNISITASSKTSNAQEAESFYATISAMKSTKTSSTSETATSSTATSSSSQASESVDALADSPDSQGGLSTGTLLLAILLPVVCIMFLAMLLAWCLIRRRRSRRTYLSSNFRRKISAPVLASLRVNGSSPLSHESKKPDIIETFEHRVYHPANGGYSEMTTPSTSSPQAGAMTTPEVPTHFMAEDAHTSSLSRIDSVPASEGQQSWFTVEGTLTATARRSQISVASQRSDTTFSESTHQLLPPPAFLSDSGGTSFRSGLDLAIPSLEQLPHAQSEQSQADSKRGHLKDIQTTSAFYSMGNESSLIFASSHQSSPRLMTGPFDSTLPRDSHNQMRSDDQQGVPDEAAHSVPEMSAPSQPRLSSQQILDRHQSQGWETEVSSMGISVPTEPSFGSSENWRVIPPSRDPQEMTYGEIVEEAPFNPTRPSSMVSVAREGARPGERANPALISPSQWGDAKTSIRASSSSQREEVSRPVSRYSKLNEDYKSPSRTSKMGESSTTPPWKREESGKKSEASFKAFL